MSLWDETGDLWRRRAPISHLEATDAGATVQADWLRSEARTSWWRQTYTISDTSIESLTPNWKLFQFYDCQHLPGVFFIENKKGDNLPPSHYWLFHWIYCMRAISQSSLDRKLLWRLLLAGSEGKSWRGKTLCEMMEWKITVWLRKCAKGLSPHLQVTVWTTHKLNIPCFSIQVFVWPHESLHLHSKTVIWKGRTTLKKCAKML